MVLLLMMFSCRGWLLARSEQLLFPNSNEVQYYSTNQTLLLPDVAVLLTAWKSANLFSVRHFFTTAATRQQKKRSDRDNSHRNGARCDMLVRCGAHGVVFGWHADCIGQHII
ncbi:hypothetical protein GTP44_22755 [Duganella sp. FT50W]|uniref:Uncharacterized protein n=1 Tax=Duganella lactea TaxID=2692173 RepID=A0A6L8MRV3_9BURK|nr:hypothetical protein [Duganella lactea]MYM84754.1 hypothetical protein [Duganella lactea]